MLDKHPRLWYNNVYLAGTICRSYLSHVLLGEYMGLLNESYRNSTAFCLTNACNTFCDYCYRSANKDDRVDLSLSDVSKVISYFERKYPCEKQRYVILSGGELFVHPDIFAIIDLLLKHGYYVRLQTNGLGICEMDTKQLEYLANPAILFKISLDGSKASIHETHRAKGSYDKILQAISLLKSFKQNNIGIISVVDKHNLHDLPNLLDLCLDYGIRGFTYNILRNAGYAQQLEDTTVTEDDVIRSIIPYLTQNKYRHLLNGTNIIQYAVLGTNILESPGQFYVFNDGNVYSDSRLSSIPLGNIKDSNDFSSVFDESKLQTFVKGSISPETYQMIIKEIKEVIQ